MSPWAPFACLIPVLVGTHLAAFFHGRAAGIRFCQELRRSLGITHYVVTEHKRPAQEGSTDK